VSANRAAGRTTALAFLLAGIAAAQTVSGTVVNGVTHEPIRSVQVRLLGASKDAPSATTDASGSFRISAPAGDYYVLAVWAGYDVPDLTSHRVHVEDGQDPAPLQLALMPYPKLRGRVLDPERHPVGGIQVSVVPFRGVTVAPAVTDKEGRYEFKTLAPGEYALLANPLEAGGSEFAPTYFPNAADSLGAERIAAKSGAELTGYDIVLRGGPFFKVSGRVVDDGGRPAARATVTIETSDAVYGTAAADAEGAFEIEHVPAADLHVSAVWKQGETELRGFAPVAVTRHDVENVTLRLAAPVVLTATVELDGEELGAAVGTYASLSPVQGVGRRNVAITGDNGIRFEAYPGRYILFYAPPRAQSGYLEAVRMGDRDITMQEFEVAPGMLPLRFILRTGGGHVNATVDDGARPGAVVLVPQEPRLRTAPFLLQSLQSTGGKWTFNNVRPGDYYALAIQGAIRLNDLGDPAYMSALAPQAAAVHVERGETANVTLTWARLP
jgi:hypothetical protein